MTRALFTRAFWIDAAERALKTAAQSALLVVGQDIGGVDLFQADLANAAGFAAGGAVLSLLMSIASTPAAGMSPASIAPPA